MSLVSVCVPAQKHRESQHSYLFPDSAGTLFLDLLPDAFLSVLLIRKRFCDTLSLGRREKGRYKSSSSQLLAISQEANCQPACLMVKPQVHEIAVHVSTE